MGVDIRDNVDCDKRGRARLHLFKVYFSWVTIIFLYFYSHMGQCK